MHPQKEQSLRLSAQQQEKQSRRKLIAARKKSLFWQSVHLLGSLQLALLLLATIGIACAVATFTESHFDTKVAHAVIYKAPWFLGWLALLCLNLFAVTLTRWPWEKKHFGFVLTHYGIITLLVGAAIGSRCGFEGNVTLQVKGTPVQKITTSKSILEVESPLTQNLYTIPFDASVTHPSQEHPRYFRIPETPLQIVIDAWSDNLQQVPSLVETKKEKEGWDALVICLRSQALHQEQLVALSLEKETMALFDFFGLANITLLPVLKVPLPAKPDSRKVAIETTPTILSPKIQNSTDLPLIQPQAHKPWLELALDKTTNEVHYQLGRRDTVQKKGTLKVGEALPLGWADWRLELLQSGHHDIIVDKIVPAASSEGNKAIPGGLPGFHAFLQDATKHQGPPQWVVSGEVTSLELDSMVIRVGYGMELRPAPFSIELLDFQIPRDEGSDAPSDFCATVRFRNLRTGASRDGLIRMNHPASFPGGWWAGMTGINYKFSQAEWNPRNLQETTLQVLYDPGWLLKWIGSLAICIGIAMMFYWSKK
ncbi:MAG: cytochrome c biogenesis protein ResB [Chthoniobacterales bacterium]|nr:cytochrome c biogenesis protein ResB [Chthoniobacterales bacterium]